jgi:hypothetical protein
MSNSTPWTLSLLLSLSLFLSLSLSCILALCLVPKLSHSFVRVGMVDGLRSVKRASADNIFVSLGRSLKRKELNRISKSHDANIKDVDI